MGVYTVGMGQRRDGRQPEDRDGRLMPAQRQLQLASLLAGTDAVSLDELARRFDVSGQTIRRDLGVLERQGLLRRTFGGAVSRATMNLSDPAFIARENVRAVEKRAIARLALAYARPEDAIFLDASTTVLALARLLPDDWVGDVVVTSLPAAMEMSRRPGVRLTIVGGEFRHSSRSVAGPLAEEMLQRLRVNTAFVSARAVDPQDGLMEAHAGEAAVKRAVLTRARRTIALADSSKLGRTVLHHIAPLGTADVLITDSRAEPEMIERLRGRCGQVLVADVANATESSDLAWPHLD